MADALEAESAGLDRGASFSVYLNRAGPALEAMNSPYAASSPLSGLRLLMVDDEPDTLQTFSALLEMEGAEMAVAGSGDEALRLAASAEFDLLVSDLAMPGMDGYSLLGKMRAAGHHMPAIAVSGMSRSTDFKRATEAGFCRLGEQAGRSGHLDEGDRQGSPTLTADVRGGAVMMTGFVDPLGDRGRLQLRASPSGHPCPSRRHAGLVPMAFWHLLAAVVVFATWMTPFAACFFRRTWTAP